MKTVLFIVFVLMASVLIAQAPAPAPGFNPPPPDMNMIQHILSDKNNTIDALMLQVEQTKAQVEQLKTAVNNKDAELKKSLDVKACKDDE